jgi:hypothetical protein
MHNVTMTSLRATIVVVEKQEILHNLTVCVLVALVIQHAMRMRHIAICGLPRSTIFFTHYLLNGRIFEKKMH